MDRIRAVVIDKKRLQDFEDVSVEGKITVYIVSGSNIIVPAMIPPCHEAPIGYVHIKSEKCPLREVVTRDIYFSLFHKSFCKI